VRGGTYAKDTMNANTPENGRKRMGAQVGAHTLSYMTVSRMWIERGVSAHTPNYAQEKQTQE